VGAQQEAVFRSWLDCMVALDLEAALNHFTDDATYHVAAWHEPLVGREAIRSGLERELVALSCEYRYTIRNIASTDAVVFVEVVDGFKRDSKDVTMHSAWVFEINQAGKISARRDYYDAKELEARLA
jgi:limonene-1,2-epoxide hydrolase